MYGDTTYSLSMGCQHAVNDLVGANPGTENVMYDFSGTCYLFLRNRVLIVSSRRAPASALGAPRSQQALEGLSRLGERKSLPGMVERAQDRLQ